MLPDSGYEAIANAGGVLLVSLELILEGAIFEGRSENGHTDSQDGGDECPERAKQDGDGDTAKGNANVARMTDKSVGSCCCYGVSPVGLDSDDWGKEAIGDHGPSDEGSSDGEQDNTSDHNKRGQFGRPVPATIESGEDEGRQERAHGHESCENLVPRLHALADMGPFDEEIGVSAGDEERGDRHGEDQEGKIGPGHGPLEATRGEEECSSEEEKPDCEPNGGADKEAGDGEFCRVVDHRRPFLGQVRYRSVADISAASTVCSPMAFLKELRLQRAPGKCNAPNHYPSHESQENDNESRAKFTWSTIGWLAGL